MPFAQQQRKEGGVGQGTARQWRKKSMHLKNLNSRWKIKMKMMILKTMPWSRQQRNRPKQEQVEGDEEEKQRKVPQKHPQLREKGKEKIGNEWMCECINNCKNHWHSSIIILIINWSPSAACDKMERRMENHFVFCALMAWMCCLFFVLCNHHQGIPTQVPNHWK